MPDEATLAFARAAPTAAGAIDLVVRRGDILLLAGGNGTGKTSLLRSLAGLAAPLRPHDVRLLGDDPATLPAGTLVERVHLALQDPAETLAGLTVEGEFRLRGQRTASGLRDLRSRDVASLSSGEARRVALALVASTPVPLLLLDEPADGLDDAAIERLRDAVRHAARTGAVVLADHTGRLADLATGRLDFGHVASPALAALPPAGTSAVLESNGGRLLRDERWIQVPGLRLPAGLHALHGPNGSGKSSLLLHLAGLLPLDDDPQTPPTRAAGTPRLLLPRASDLFTRERVSEELAGCDDDVRDLLVPPGLLARHPLSLSAGEGQRVALAKCLGHQATIYLLDEPEAHLDAAGRSALWSLLSLRISAGACIVVATHDPALLAAAHTRTALGVLP